jgi:hypothetical protein
MDLADLGLERHVAPASGRAVAVDDASGDHAQARALRR